MDFQFHLIRSNAREHQAKNLRCKAFAIDGLIDANSINVVKEHALKCMTLAGVWSLRIRNAQEGCQWIPFGPFDTRSPDQIPALPKTENLKPKTGASRQ